MLSRQQPPSSLEQTSSPLYSSTLSLGRLHCNRYRSLRPTTTDARQSLPNGLLLPLIACKYPDEMISIFLHEKALRFTEATRDRIEKAMDDCLTFDQQLS
nr:hypothetical protein Iba_chr13bCG13420 [Ipomoea batatas]